VSLTIAHSGSVTHMARHIRLPGVARLPQKSGFLRGLGVSDFEGEDLNGGKKGQLNLIPSIEVEK